MNGPISDATIESPNLKPQMSATNAAMPGTRSRSVHPSATCAADWTGGPARGGSRSGSTGRMVSASNPAMQANMVAQSVRAKIHSSSPPPRIMPMRYAPTWMPFASPRSRVSRMRTASPSVATSWQAATTLNRKAAASTAT